MAKAELFHSLGGEFFDEMRTGQQTRNVVGVVYLWHPIDAGELKQKDLKDDPLKVCDNYWTHHDGNARCYQLHAIFRKPLVLPHQFERFEEMFAEGHSTNWMLVRKGGFDSVVYTPHEYGRGLRCAVLLQPTKQVMNLEPFHGYDEEELLAKRQTLNAKWHEITGYPRGPYTTEQLQEWELRLMALRYAYYVEADPIVTDHEYDRLDKAVVPWLPKGSPLHRPGSDMESSYTPEHRSYANWLRFNHWIRTPRAEQTTLA
jgi:hypothetical protein